MAKTYATWNPSDKHANITLSNGDLTVTSGVSNAHKGVRSTISKTTGKWYWEITVGTKGVNDGLAEGVADGTHALTTEIGYSSVSESYLSQGYKVKNSAETAGLATYTAGAVIGMALDAGTGDIEWFKNNVSQGGYTPGITGTLFAATNVYDVNDAATANFGATALTYTPPAGYNAGLYDGADDVATAGFLFLMVN